ncbi:MAG: hypothetical protein MUE50_06655, partial [Pirellulaceae bacterium]|nr:hypothetical protein [Pirellulaceae bacterium]
VGGQGITGKLYRLKNRKRFGGSFYGGTLVLNPSPAYFATLLPYMLGPLDSGEYIPVNCLERFGLLLSRDLDPPWEYQAGVVAGWRLSGRGMEYRERGEPDLLRLELDMIFSNETRQTSLGVDLTWPNPEPGLGSGDSYEPYLFSDAEDRLCINGALREMYQFELAYSNMLSIRYAQSLSPSSLCSVGRQLRLGIVMPWDSTNEDLYDQSHVGYQAVLSFVNGNHMTRFTIANLTTPPESPYTRSRREIWFETNGEGYGDHVTDTPELVVINTVGTDATTEAPATCAPTTLAASTAAPTTAAPTTPS